MHKDSAARHFFHSLPDCARIDRAAGLFLLSNGTMNHLQIDALRPFIVALRASIQLNHRPDTEAFQVGPAPGSERLAAAIDLPVPVDRREVRYRFKGRIV